MVDVHLFCMPLTCLTPLHFCALCHMSLSIYLFYNDCSFYYTSALRRGRGYTVLPLSVRPSVRPSYIFFVAFFSVAIDGRSLIFGHKRHIGTPYRWKRFWTHQIPTSCLLILLSFIHIEHAFVYAHFSSHFSKQLLMTGI